MMESRIAFKSGMRNLKPAVIVGGILEYCRNHEYGLAIWRDPTTGLTEGVIDFNDTMYSGKIELESMEPGFFFAPYDRNENPHFITANVHFVLDETLQFKAGKEFETQPVVQHLNSYEPEFETGKNILTANNDDQDQNDFLLMVKNAIELIHEGRFKKIVPSRTKVLEITSLNIPDIFLMLADKYPNAFISITYTPEHGIWMGASPELLVKITNNRYFETISLAGTQSNRDNVAPGDVAWKQKEIEEQALVSRYIINCFKKIRLREFEEIGPKTVVAGNLIHLKTRYLVDMEAAGFPDLGSVMLNLLHPTSAICGMPLEPAENWLKMHEKYNREFYSGYLGPVNINSQTSLFVNLRCMKIGPSSVHFFAGAGVTEDSVPEKEFEETEMKMNTLLNVIREHSTNF